MDEVVTGVPPIDPSDGSIVTEQGCQRPTHHQIADRAFELYTARCEAGDETLTDKDDWRTAEEQIWIEYVHEKDKLEGK